MTLKYDKSRKKWILVSKENPKKILRIFGKIKPSSNQLLREEKRIQYFKHLRGYSSVPVIMHPRRTRRKITYVRKHNRRVPRKSLETIINYGSYPKVFESLGKDKHKSLIYKDNVEKFMEDWPEYKMKSKKAKKIDIIEDRTESIKRDPDAKFAPGMYLIHEKEIRLFPIKPDDIPENERERANKLYHKERFPAVLVHELEHHSTLPKKLRNAAELSDEEIINLPQWEKNEIQRLQKENENLAIKAEDEWLAKLEKRKQEESK